MDKEPGVQHPDYKRQILQIIQNAPQNIDTEFAKGQNSWLACLNTRITSIASYVDDAMHEGTIDSDEAARIGKPLDKLIEKANQLMDQYPTRDVPVPEALQKELLEELNILK